MTGEAEPTVIVRRAALATVLLEESLPEQDQAEADYFNARVELQAALDATREAR